MNNSQNLSAALAVSPTGHVYLDESLQAEEQLPAAAFENMKTLFDEGAATGLLHLGIQDFASLPSSFIFWQSFSRRFVTAVCKRTQAEEDQQLPDIAPPDRGELIEIMTRGLCMKGFEYLCPDVLTSIWQDMAEALKKELQGFGGHVQDYFKHYNPRWNLVGRVCFHLAENKTDEDRPFAFLATYTTHLSQKATAQHLPLKRALQEYSCAKSGKSKCFH
jgi:hypothetical protein